MGRITRAEEIRRKQEQIAIKMQDKALLGDATLDTMLDVFDRTTKWMAVANKLEDEGDTRIDEFKRRITGDGEVDKHISPSRRPKGYVEPPAKQPRLAALKNRLPGRGNGSPDGDSGDPGDTSPAAA